MKTTRKPRCRDNLARAFKCTEGEPKAIIRAFLASGANSRRALIGTLVEERLGTAASYGLECEPYLRAAVCCWCLSACRSRASVVTYLFHFWWWVKTSDRRSLSEQASTRPQDLVDALLRREDEGKAPRYIAAGRDVCRSWFTWLWERGYVLRSPVTKEVKRLVRIDHQAVRRGSGVREALTLSQAQSLVAWAKASSPNAGASVMLQCVAGLRSAEVAALERRHLVEIEGVWKLTVPGKGQKTRTVILEPVVVEALARVEREGRRRGTRAALLLPARGERYCPLQVQRWAKRALASVAKPELSSHALRRTAATLLIDAGATLEEAQRHLGHSNNVTTARCYVTRRPAMTATTGIQP